MRAWLLALPVALRAASVSRPDLSGVLAAGALNSSSDSSDVATNPSLRDDCALTPEQWLQRFRNTHGGKLTGGESTLAQYHPPRVHPTSRSRIPRRVMQMAKNASAELRGSNAQWMRTWWGKHNPDWEYVLLDEADCTDFVQRFASPTEQLAYARVLHGAQRSDMLRLLFLRSLGGVYVDTDAELLTPLSRVVPQNASMVAPHLFQSDFLAFEPDNPFLRMALDQAVQRVNNATTRLAQGIDCGDSHGCVVRITGPTAFMMAMVGAAREYCSTGSTSGALPDQHVCRTSSLEAARTMHRCPPSRVRDHDPVNTYCDAVVHWDCRNSKKHRECGASHYSKKDQVGGLAFFNVHVDRVPSSWLAASQAKQRPCASGHFWSRFWSRES